MAVAFKGVSALTVSDDNTGTAKSTSFSANVEGDFLVAIIAVSNASTSVSVDMLDEAGWTRMPANTWLSATAGGTHVYYRFAPAGGITSQTFTAAATTGHIGRGAVFTGVDTVNPIDSGPFYQNHTSGTLTSVIAPAYQTTVADSMGVLIMNRDASPVVVTGPAGYTVDADTGSANPGDGVMIHLSHQLHATTGTYTPGAHTWAATQEAIAMSFALRADTGGGGGTGDWFDDLTAMGIQHAWEMDGNLNDGIGSANGTNAGGILTGNPLSPGLGNSWRSNGTTDRITIPASANIANSALSQKVVLGKVRLNSIQPPPKRIYGEGTATNAFQLVCALGNSTMFEVVTGGTVVQIYGLAMAIDRTYHFAMIFSGTGFDNLCSFLIDGVEQLNPPLLADRQPNISAIPTRAPVEFADPVGGVGVGGDTVLLNAPNQGEYQEWAAGAGFSVSIQDIRVNLFEKRAVPGVTITSGTQAAMQTQVDAIANSLLPDEELNIKVEAVTGDGDITLTADNITHDVLASINVQYAGAGTLTWININGSDAKIGSAPYGGNVIIVNPVTLRVTALDAATLAPIVGARVRVTEDVGDTVVLSGVTDASGIVEDTAYLYSADQNITGRIRKTSSSPLYKQGNVVGEITSQGFTQNVLMIRDE